jgi:hypothetical protein
MEQFRGEASGGAAEFATALLAVARDGDASVRNAARDALGTASVRRWLAVDEALRQRWWWAPRWSRGIAADLADGDLDTLRLVLAGCHHNGRIREAAVVRLADRLHPAPGWRIASAGCFGTCLRTAWSRCCPLRIDGFDGRPTGPRSLPATSAWTG